MTRPTPRLMARLQREYPGRGDGSAEDIARALDNLTDQLAGSCHPEQLQAAIILGARGDHRSLVDLIRCAKVDWRDAILAGGLGYEDGPGLMAREFPEPPKG